MSGIYLTGPETPPDAAGLIQALRERLGDDWDVEVFERGGYRHLYAECCRQERADALSEADEVALDIAWGSLAEQQGRQPKQRERDA